MIIVEKNEGEKIRYKEVKTSICFDDDLTINLAKRQKDWEVHIDVCTDCDGALVIGAESGRYYVAQIVIPPIVYAENDTSSETKEDAGNNSIIALPLDMEKVTLTLWALENRASEIE